MKNAGFGNITQFKIPTWSECAPGASAAQKKITTEIYDLLKEYSAVGFDKSKKAESNIKSAIAKQEKSYRYSKLRYLKIFGLVKEQMHRF